MYQTLCSSFFSSYGEGELIFGQSLYSFISWVFSRRQGVRIFVRDGRVRRRTFWIFSAWNKFTDDNLEAVWVVTLKLTGQCAMLLLASVHVVDKSEVPGSKVDFFFQLYHHAIRFSPSNIWNSAIRIRYVMFVLLHFLFLLQYSLEVTCKNVIYNKEDLTTCFILSEI